MTNQEAIKYVKTCIDNLRQYEGNEQFIDAMDIVIAMAENGNDNDGKALLYCTNKTYERTKKQMVNRACEWLDADIKGRHDKSYWMLDELVDRFRKAMEE